MVLFEAGQRQPSAVLKVNRYAGGADRGRAEAAALELARGSSTGWVVVPRLLGADTVRGRAVTLETAAEGRLLSLLADDDPRAARACLDRLVTWLSELAVRTAVRGTDGATSAALEGELQYLLPRWPGAEQQLREAVGALQLARTPLTLAHRDLLDGGNVVVDEDGRATVIDWETASAAAPPLLDLLPMALRLLAVTRLGGRSPDAVLEEVRRTARGESPDSGRLFEMIWAHADRLALPPSCLGPLAVLAWARHGAAADEHTALLRAAGLPAPEEASWARGVAEAWLRDPLLGVHWVGLTGGRSPSVR